MPSRLHKAACPLPHRFPVSHRQGTHADRDRANSRHDRRLRSGRVEASGHVLRASAWVRTEILSLSKGLAGLQTVHPLPHRDRKRHRFTASTPMVRFSPLLPPSGQSRHLPGRQIQAGAADSAALVEKQPDATLKVDASAFFTRVGRALRGNSSKPAMRMAAMPCARTSDLPRVGATRDFAIGARPEKDMSDR